VIPEHPIFHGSIVALPTPFVGEQLDLPNMLHLVERQIQARTNALVIAGSTGEGVALDMQERLALFEYSAGVAGLQIPIIASIGCSATRDAVRLAQAAEAAGVQALLVTTPAYNRPGQLGLERHFGAVAQATDLPIALYNIPGRTGVDLLPESVGRLVEQHANIVAIKEASDSIERLGELLALQSIAVLTGDDHLMLEALELGVQGVVGVVGNLVPSLVKQLIRQHKSDPDSSQTIAKALEPLIKALHSESNPAPLKYALECLGVMQSDLRLPLVPISSTNAKLIHSALIQTELLEL
jgi:4-hydroxy-tetrahydrodipicolinate synthase